MSSLLSCSHIAADLTEAVYGTLEQSNMPKQHKSAAAGIGPHGREPRCDARLGGDLTTYSWCLDAVVYAL